MKRGEIWTVAGGAAYAGKPRPAVIVRDDRFDANDSIVVCPLTTDQRRHRSSGFPSSPAPKVDCVHHAG
jgi:mRNA-degrading endonuclease toxin of MazEF toxin-antitoxin module